MWQSNSIGSRKNSVSEPFRELFQPFIDMRVIGGFDFMIRFELLSIFAASQSLSIPYAIRKNWKRFYPEIPNAVETELFAEMIRYIDSYRLGMKLLSEGQTINKRSIRENAILPMALLLAINEGNGEVDPDEVCAKAVELLAKTESEPRKLKTRLKDALMRLSCPLSSQTTLMPETVKTLQNNLPMLRRLFDSLYRTLERRNIPDRKDAVSNPNSVSENAGHDTPAEPPLVPVSDVQAVLPVAPQSVQTEAVEETEVVDDSVDVKATRQASRYNSSYTQNCSPLLFSRGVCLLELCLMKKQEGEAVTEETGRIVSGNEKLEPLFKAYWLDIFSEPYSPELYQQVSLIIRGNRFLDSISRLFRYPLEDLRSDKILRAIIIARSVNCALSRIPRRTTINTLIEESLSLYEKFNVVSVGAEEKDIVSYIERFQTLDGQLDERVLTLFRTHKEIIDRSIQKTQEGLTKNRTRNRYVEAVTREKDQRINDLEEQVFRSRYHALYELTEMLSSETYGYLLGRFYRIAQGYDTPDERTPALCRDFMQILHYFGIDPIDGDQIGKPYDQDAKKLIIDNFTGITQRGIVFPGWRVANDTVILPVATEINSTNDE